MASLDRVRAVSTANVAPSAGISGAAMAWTWSASSEGTIAPMARRLPAATTSASASETTTSSQTGCAVSHMTARRRRPGRRTGAPPA